MKKAKKCALMHYNSFFMEKKINEKSKKNASIHYNIFFTEKNKKPVAAKFVFQNFGYCKLLIITNPLRADRAFFLDFGLFVYCCVVCVLLGCRVSGLGFRVEFSY